MASRYEKKLIAKSKLQAQIDSLLGKKTEFEITLKAIEALFDFTNGVKQAANIQNASLSQKAKDGLQYLQDIGQIISEIKSLKQSTDTVLDSIESSPEEPDESGAPLPPKEEPSTNS